MMQQAVSTPEMAYFSRNLLVWYKRQKRDLPWRESSDPYRVWVSEIMLQQTRVDTVIPYFRTFLDRFPTVQALAAAPEEEVLKCWEGLGYYSRARNLQAGARMVVERHGGIIPNDKEAVSSLKGVGPYTSGAIMSIAFNQPEPAVDGNVMRVLSRYFCLEDDIAKPATRVRIEKLAASLIPEGEAASFNQALMELGALVCTPRSPGCLPCPVMEQCSARISGRESELPIKTKAKPPRNEYRVAALVQGSGSLAGKLLVRQRPASGLLAGMWELPHTLLPDDAGAAFSDSMPKEQGELAEQLLRHVEADSGLLIRPTGWLADADHIFSHIHWRMRFFTADLGEAFEASPAAPAQKEATDGIAAESAADDRLASALRFERSEGRYRWIDRGDMEQLPFPNLFLRILTDYWRGGQPGNE